MSENIAIQDPVDQFNLDAVVVHQNESLETDVLDPRQQIIDEVLAPYHIHYAEGIEGDAISPESSSRNLDALLVTTKLIRDKTVTNRLGLGKKAGWEPNPDIDWFFEKYEAEGITRDEFDTPAKVVRYWLEKMGPHNDSTDAASDFLSAREWLIASNEARLNGSQDVKNQQFSKEYGLIADIDIELSESVDDVSQYELLSEAASYFEAYALQQEAADNPKEALTARLKLTSVRIELKRLEFLGTTQLTTDYTEEQYALLEGAVETEIEKLEEYFIGKSSVSLEQFSPEAYESLSEKEMAALDKKLGLTAGTLFELFSYINIVRDIIENDDLAVQKFRPGTYREESGTAHKVDSHSNSRQLKQANGEVIDLPPHGFNYNFDFILTALDTSDRALRGATFQTVYFQNKINPDHAPADKATEASKKFFAGKQFYFIRPDFMLSDLQRGQTPRESSLILVETMKKALHKHDDFHDSDTGSFDTSVS